MDQAESSQASYLITGLGNPGKEYRDTRHNSGFMLLDRLAEKLSVTFSRVEMKALVTKSTYMGQRLILAKPQTYMNLSGQAVNSLLRFYKVPLDNLLVVYDDVDLPLGTIRLRPAGGSAGQKGMISIIERLGTEEFPRMRLGVGRPPGRMDSASYVLQNFTKDEKELFLPTLDRSVQAVFLFITQGIEAAMNQYNNGNQPD
jgi:PTH1 family peptidyl-tRNA hydrolase